MPGCAKPHKPQGARGCTSSEEESTTGTGPALAAGFAAACAPHVSDLYSTSAAPVLAAAKSIADHLPAPWHRPWPRRWSSPQEQRLRLSSSPPPMTTPPPALALLCSVTTLAAADPRSAERSASGTAPWEGVLVFTSSALAPFFPLPDAAAGFAAFAFAILYRLK